MISSLSLRNLLTDIIKTRQYKSMTSTDNSESIIDDKCQSTRDLSLSQPIVQVSQQNIQSSHQDQSSNIQQGLEQLNTIMNRVTYHNLLVALNQIKQKECLLLKCQILTKTISKILNRKMEENKRYYIERVNGFSAIRLDTHSNFDFKVQQSLETSLGMESVAWSLEIQKPRMLCQNCRKQIYTKTTLSKPFIIESIDLPGTVFRLKEPERIEPGIFSTGQHIPNKIMNLLPNQQLTEVQDKNIEFINIGVPLFLQISSKLIQSPQLQIFSVKQIQSQKQNSPKNVREQISQEIKLPQLFPPIQIQIPQIYTFPNASINLPKKDFQKSFIQNLKIQESKHSGGFLSPKYERPYPQISQPRIVSEQMLESQIIPVNYENKDLFVKSIELNRNPYRTYSLPKQSHFYPQRFTDSQIKRTLFDNNRTRATESFNIERRRQVQERVGSTRVNNTHKPTFFETAYYF